MNNTKKQNLIDVLKILFIINIFIIPFCVFGFASESYFENIEHEKGPFLQLYGDSRHSISIMWETNEAMDSIVYYSDDPQNIEENYVEEDEIVNIHKIEINDLQENRKYYYKISSTSDQNFLGKDEIFQFKTAPATSQSFKVSIIGDTRTNDYFKSSTMGTIVETMTKYDQDFLIHTGNLWTIEDGYEEPSIIKTQSNIDRFFSTFSPLTSSKPLMAAVGKYQYGEDHGFYITYLNQNGDVDGSDYGFDYANTHFSVLSSPYENYDKYFDPERTWLDLSNQNQLDWLETDLINAQSYDWRVVIIRCPLDSSEFFSSDELNNRLRTILNENDVSCVFMSGNKCYEHWNVDGLDYFITGCSGIAPETYGMINENTKKISLESNFVNLEVTSDSLQIEARTFDDQLIEEVEIPISY